MQGMGNEEMWNRIQRNVRAVCEYLSRSGNGGARGYGVFRDKRNSPMWLWFRSDHGLKTTEAGEAGDRPSNNERTYVGGGYKLAAFRQRSVLSPHYVGGFTGRRALPC
jgi:hypothetical protein